MKKICTTVLFLIALAGIIQADDVIIEVKIGYFFPVESAFKDIYGAGVSYGAKLTIGVWKNLSLWMEGSYFSKKGELSFTKEETKVKIFPVGAGFQIHIERGIVKIYGGSGVKYYQYNESNIIGEVSKGSLGYVSKAGILINVYKGLTLDIFGDYAYCKMKPADFRINIGGFSAGIGLGYTF